MPKVLSYTPAWLSAPAPASRLFRRNSGDRGDAVGDSRYASEKGYKNVLRQRRVIAYRGSEVFVADGNKIRWADLALVKDDWISKARETERRIKREESVGEDEFPSETKLRDLKLKYVVEPILQLVPSPTKDLLAIVTAHTVHICVVPDSSHLAGPDIGPISPKTQILGPTIHVLEQAPITNVLWHPLGVDGNALVTVTSDAVVRIWELDMDNRSSLEEPTVALDLRKLRDARSAEDKLHPSRLGTSKGFSLSAVGMEVASACFGGSGSMDEGGWPGMTLWIAMTGGDVYALCPLLPSKWQPPSTAIPSLTTSIATKFAGSTEMNASAKEREIYAAQGQWITEIEKEKPIVVPGRTSLSPSISIYSRPKGTSFIPRLQGPFRIVPGDVDNDLNLADIYVVAPKLDAIDALDDDEGEFLEGTLDGLSTSLICLLTNEGRVYLCLDLDGVEGQWLASKKSNLKNHFAEEDEPEIVILEALDTAQTNSGRTNLGRPTFSRDVCSRYAFFVCHAQGVYYLSVDEWVELLENEFENPSASGAGLRLSNLTTSSHVLREQIFTFKHDPSKSEDIQPSAPIVLLDSDLGYFVLSLYQNSACAAIMDAPPEDLTEDSDDSITTQESTDLVLAAPPRVPYQPSERFSQPVALAAALESHINRRHKLSMKDEVRLSTATLDVMNEAHRFLSRETFTLGSAIGDLFSRCEEMQQEFRFQIGRVREIAGKVDKINEEDADDYEIEGPRGASKLEERLKGIEERHRELSMRHEALRKRVAQAGGRPLSEKEQAWTREVDKMAWTLITPDDEAEGTEGVRQKQYWSRLQEVRHLAESLVAREREATERIASDLEGDTSRGTSFKVPQDIRRNKMELLKGLLERETALVDAATKRLELLNLAG